jgi:5-formyltetrahydrofolate cyclo-ligase
MEQDKKVLRQQLKAARQALAIQDVTDASRVMAVHAVNAIDWLNIRTVHVYLPIQKQREADTRPLVAQLRQDHPLLRIATWRSPGQGAISLWLHPEQESSELPEKYDVIVVPLLGFNGQGHRIGYGGGFYDRFLASQHPAITIGLCYQNGRCEFIAEPHDIPLQYIVTEQGISRPGAT